jgi:hypothetical protein
MDNIIEWYATTGNLGGCKGLTIDFDKNLVTNWKGVEGKLDEWKVTEILWAIEENIKNEESLLAMVTKRLAVTKTRRERIEGGYKVIEPLSEKGRERYITNREAHSSALNNLNNKLNKFKQ